MTAGVRMSNQNASATRYIARFFPAKTGIEDETKKRVFAGGSILGALAMSSCCILPLVLFSLGLTGTWLGSLTALYPYKWYLFVPAAGFIAGGFYLVYRKPKAIACEADASCASPVSDRINKVLLWSSTVVVLAALAFTYTAPALLGVE